MVRLESSPAVSYAGLSDLPIASVGPKNILLLRPGELRPWDRENPGSHVSSFRIPKEAVSYVLRGKVIHQVRR